MIPYETSGKKGFIFVKTKKDGKWELPGGKIDLFEDVRVAMAREMVEETGVEIVLEKFIGTWDFRNEKDNTISNRVFVGKYIEGELKTTNPNEIGGIRIFTLKEIRELFRVGKIRAGRANVKPIEEYLRGTNYPLSSNHTLF